MILELHRGIASDVTQIMEYYAAIAGEELASEFYSELRFFFERALEFPLAYRVRSHGLRRVDLKRFPFHFFFRTIPPKTVRVLVIRHHKQRSLKRSEVDLLSITWSVEGMKFIPVESRMILGVRYNKDTLDMDVVFRTGEKYRYKGVPQSVFDGLMSAESIGQYMHRYILNHFEYERIN
jgi:plasmid stabilization system protein ParE